MKLRTLATIGLIAALSGLGYVGLWGMAAWQDINERIADVGALEIQLQRMDQMAAAIDYITLVRPDATVIAALSEDARGLGQELDDVNRQQARLATRHLEEISAMGEFLLETRIPDNYQAPAPRDAEQLLLLSRQIRIHHAGAREALAALHVEHNSRMQKSLYQDLQRLAVIIIAFAFLTLLTALVIHRRLIRPLRTISAGLRAHSRGELETRIKVRHDDEIGELARTFNSMAEQRQHHEKQLQESRDRFSQIAENIGEAFWLAEPDNSRILYLSPAYEAMWGHSREAVYRDASLWTKAIHEADRPRVLKALERHPEGLYQAEYRVVHPDGTVRWINDRSFPVRDEAGRIVRIAGVARDVTELREHQSQLSERIKELRCLFQALELTTSQELTPTDIVARIVDHLPETMRFEAEAIARIELNGERFSSHDWGEPVETIDTPIRLDDREIGRIEVAYREQPIDAMPNEPLFLPEEQALINAIATHLSKMIDQRRLSETLARSERLKAIGEMTGGIAHDFNNLLTVIIGNAELLQELLGQDNPAMAELAEMIMTAGQRGSDLTTRMLAFARRQVLEPEIIDINRMLSDMEPLLQRSLGEDIELKFNFDESQPLPALIDRSQIESAVLNLCINARDAMPRGGRLTLETQPIHLDSYYAAILEEVEPGDYTLIAVSDTGTGIDPEHLGHVFEPFFTTKERGTGLGLSMIYGLVKQLRGHVRIYSEPGQGTTVRIYLPAATGDEPVDREAAIEPESLQGNETILLVEDNDLVRRYTSEQLKALGYKLFEASNAPDALKLLQEHDDIDLLFTDVVMPGGINGRELADRARAMYPGLKVLYTSGYTQNAIIHHGRLDPGVDLLAKPYHRRELGTAIRKVLEKDE
ncbi:PAS domain-containing protein [Wenzhouxiangella sp. AB-CW3]|uniref:ATP-binding protein n=1 Tax=Wenzhouxiangella sp. AB-CW3 TaxID=2771012 RepID=UPI00168AD972|nr:ATP-binding protein [Wenzhouxiangella sp. AB-CW3]QOC22201.1 PAS domain-containing protein [Wenzhouxiangella sp. AB-CW3]